MKKWKRKIAKLKSKTTSYKNNSGALNCDSAVTNSKDNKYHVYKVCSFKVDFDTLFSDIDEVLCRKGLSSDDIRAMSEEELIEVVQEIVKELDVTKLTSNFKSYGIE